MEAAGETCDDRTHDAVRRSAPVRACVDQVWPKVDAKRLVFGLLSSAANLATHADGLLSAAEQRAIVWPVPARGPGSARWSRADQVLIDEAADLIERTPSLAHVVVDEAQDLSPMECRAIGRRCATGSATVLGDIAQGTTPWAATSWPALLGHLGKPDAAVRELDVGYRVPRQILDYASQLLPSIAPGLRPAASLRQDPGSLTVESVPPAQTAGGWRRSAPARLTCPDPWRSSARTPRRPRPPLPCGPPVLTSPCSAPSPRQGDALPGRRAGHARQGAGVRSRGARRAWPHRGWRGLWPAAALCGAHPCRIKIDDFARRTGPGRALFRTIDESH